MKRRELTSAPIVKDCRERGEDFVHGPEEVYGPEELLRLLRSAEVGFAQAILTTFALTGACHGEGLGFMWRDMDFEQKEIAIRRNWSGRYRDGEPVFWTPKSRHSIRKVRIPDELCLALKKWKLQCPPSKWNLMFQRQTAGHRIERQRAGVRRGDKKSKREGHRE